MFRLASLSPTTKINSQSNPFFAHSGSRFALEQGAFATCLNVVVEVVLAD